MLLLSRAAATRRLRATRPALALAAAASPIDVSVVQSGGGGSKSGDE
jgi:hypothetical protein